ncbi:Nucleoside phosphorylase [Verrucomicrobium sp. GAS474]|uniref:phosphorylase family protein n=1 Tax=Verrucomicrobium sp. GAS474 TaxID=1882831 RepID=UPI00087A9E51|nr:hypothetical protein [Verrucomicrobium sp. GAS474]SDU01600.1 Nucleoside phosphorylase [Verrucomicrobium sp. GAS474]
MIAFAFALDNEAAPLLHRLYRRKTILLGEEVPCHVGILDGKEGAVVFVLIVGMGAETARRRTALALAELPRELERRKLTPLRLLVLAGYAGALRAGPAFRRNTLFVASNYLTPSAAPWLDKALPDTRRALLHSAAAVAATPASRRALADQGFDLVDMETAAVADEAERFGVPFLPLRVVSDGLDDVLPQEILDASFDLVRQQPTPLRLLAALFARPWDIVPFVRFVSHLNPARKALSHGVEQIAEMAR